MNRTTMLIALLAVLILGANRGYAEQPPSPCHPNPNADQDMAAVAERGDIASLPAPLESQILRIAGRPHSQLPTQAFNEADGASQLFQYYLLDANGFEPNVFTRFADMAQEAATSRVVAGVAFPSDVFSGLDLGQNGKLISVDRHHGFKLPAFHLRADITPGAVEKVRFVPDQAGKFTFFCDVFCGDGHEDMSGTVTVIE